MEAANLDPSPSGRNRDVMTAWLLLVPAVALLAIPAIRRAGRPRTRAEIGPALAPLWWAARAYCRLWHRLGFDGWAPLPAEGPAILIANHTCCIDHLLIQSRSRRVLGFVIARNMYEMPIVHRFCVRVGCIPVERDGRDLRAMRSALRALEEGRVVPIFPEGRITPQGGRALGPIRSGAAFLALRSGAPVIPAFISGTPETVDVGPALWRRSRSRVVFGPPVDLSDFNPSQAGDRDALARASRRFEQALLDLQARSLGRTTSETPADVGPVA
ncbi:lysophospholipid acyltransferase family protein [Paludisphaera sp.]|uniref:lysophospholipid acyltransferase family protein n=1 Tax=Paludisphaera sp. TaxID=2017432 RepID=UPI00301C5A85